MGITANSGPLVSYGIAQTSSGGVNEYNEERGPSLFDLGQAFIDPRPQYNYDPGSPVGTQIKAFFGGRAQVDYIPFAVSTCALLQSSGSGQAVAGTALTLVGYSTLGAFPTTIIAPETGKSVSTIALDSTAAVLTFGSGGTVALWNPAAGTGRCVSVTASSSIDVANGATFTVAGRDMYGFKLTQTVTPTTQSSVGITTKAFKYVTSVAPNSTGYVLTSTGYAVGFVDTFGLPIKLPYTTTDLTIGISTGFGSIMILSAPTSATLIMASTVATATSTTPDPRGTYASSVATTGTSATIASGAAVRVQITQNITATMASNITASDQTAIFGIAQFSSV